MIFKFYLTNRDQKGRDDYHRWDLCRILQPYSKAKNKQESCLDRWSHLPKAMWVMKQGKTWSERMNLNAFIKDNWLPLAYHFLTLFHSYTSIKSTKSPSILSTHFPNQIKSLSIVTNYYNFITSISWFSHFSYQPIKHYGYNNEFKMNEEVIPQFMYTWK